MATVIVGAASGQHPVGRKLLPRYTSRLEAFQVPSYPQKMQGVNMSDDFMKAIWSRKEVRGMRANYAMSVKGLMTGMRVLPEDHYNLVLESDQPVEKGAVFAEIVRRFGDPSQYKAAPKVMHM